MKLSFGPIKKWSHTILRAAYLKECLLEEPEIVHVASELLHIKIRLVVACDDLL